MCYCQTGGKDLSASISTAEEKIPSLGSEIKASEAKLAQAKESLKQAQTDRAAAQAAMKEATAVREKDAASYADLKAESEANLAAANKAITAVSNGMSGSFLQTPAAGALRQVVGKAGLLDSDDQRTLLAFLSQNSKYAPQSGAIVGILKQMVETMQANLDDATASENEAIKIFKGLIAAKTKEIEACGATVEAKTKQIGELGVDIVEMKEDLTDTEKGLAEDQKFLADLQSSCSTKSAEWDERQKTRAEELVALADTIKILNNDDALELFKKTLPSAGA